MIGMFVSDQNRGERIRVHAQGVQALKGFLAAQTCVDKQASAPGGDQGAIAGARRSENCDGDDGAESLP